MRSYRIARGDSLSVIAYHHGTSVKALAAANGLRNDDVIRAGDVLVIPEHHRPGGGDDWLKYARKAKNPGRLDLVGYKRRFRGTIGSGRISESARREISAVLGATGSRPPVPDRLIRLLVRVSDTFGGKSLRVVSGYRNSSFFSDSRHKRSEAVDFSIPGVPNTVLRQYLLLLDNVGVGYYPNSSFVHLDVRPCVMQWVDYAGPGEAPRTSPAQRFAKKLRPADLDDIAENVVAEMEAAIPAAPSASNGVRKLPKGKASHDPGANDDVPDVADEALPEATAPGRGTADDDGDPPLAAAETHESAPHRAPRHPRP